MKLTHTEIVQKLVGNIHPCGDASIDDERFDNLKNMCELVENLISKIELVASNSSMQEYSIKRSGEYAHNFIKQTWLGANQ